MNDLYNAGSEHPTAWSDLSAFHRQSNIAAADHLLVKVRYLLDDDSLTALTGADCRRAYARYRELYPEREELFQEMEHRRWMRFSQMCNWKYADALFPDVQLEVCSDPRQQPAPSPATDSV